MVSPKKSYINILLIVFILFVNIFLLEMFTSKNASRYDNFKNKKEEKLTESQKDQWINLLLVINKIQHKFR